MQLDDNMRHLSISMERKVQGIKQKLTEMEVFLQALNPKKVLTRGFVYLTDMNGSMIMDVKRYRKLSSGQKFIIKFKDGEGIAKTDQENH